MDQLSERTEAQSVENDTDSEYDIANDFTNTISQDSTGEPHSNSTLKPFYYTVQQINDFLDQTKKSV